MLNKDMLNELFYDSKKYFDEVEAYSFSRREKILSLKNNTIINLEEKESAQTSLRVIHNGKTGFSTTSGIQDIGQLINFAKETSTFGETSQFSLNNYCTNYNNVDVYSSEIHDCSLTKLYNIANKTFSDIEKHLIGYSYQSILSTIYDEIKIIKNNGIESNYKKTIFFMNMRGKVYKNNKSLFINCKEASTCNLDFTHEVRKLIFSETEIDMINEKVHINGIYNVIITPYAVYDLFKNFFSIIFNGKMVEAGLRKSNKFSPLINIKDDGISGWGINSQPFDDEGIPCGVTDLVTDGLAFGAIYDLRVASIANKQSTGNGKRGWGTPPTPLNNNFTVSGNIVNSLSDIVSSLKEGIIIDCVQNDGSSNYAEGYFSGDILRAYYVMNGKINYRIVNKKIKINLYEALKNIKAIADDFTCVAGEMRTPSLLISNVNIF